MAKRLRFPVLTAFLVAGVFMAAWAGAFRRRDPYAFLQNRSPRWTGLMKRSVLGPGFSELRIYVWDEEYARVRDRMKKELSGQGFILESRTKETEWWSNPKGYAVAIEKGQSLNYREAVMQEDGDDPNGVTVTCFNLVSDTWLVRLQYAFEPEKGGPPIPNEMFP